jgi:LPS-assembly protein
MARTVPNSGLGRTLCDRAALILDAPMGAFVFALALLAVGAFGATSAAAQTDADASAKKAISRLTAPVGGERKPMLLESDRVDYDSSGDGIVATGNVQVYYNGYTLTADKVTFYRSTKRAVAEGKARLVEPDGNVVKADKIDITQNFREGFISALSVDSTERSRFRADSAERKEGRVTAFKNGTYSACQTCVNDPNTPPFWRIRAEKITHDQETKTATYENASLEFLGVPIAYLPYFQHPDPTVERKTGFLTPGFIVSSQLGAGVLAPFVWSPASDWDVTLQPAFLSRQGVLGDVEFRHLTEFGEWSLRAVGIDQKDPRAFAGTSGETSLRAAVFTKGQFNINSRWTWGWDASLSSDRKFIPDYKLARAGTDQSISTIYLSGLGKRNYFDARVYGFQIFEDDDPRKNVTFGSGINSRTYDVGGKLADKQPFVHPVIDYDYIHPDPIGGGELSAHFNLTSLTRNETDMNLSRQVYGAAGTYSRASLDVKWQREYIDSIGQIFRPFARFKGDVFASQSTDPNVNWIDNGGAAKAMPTLGFEYRYPFLATGPFGNHIIEPIAQLIARPNETYVGRLANEDSQSLVYDTTTLFEDDKFSGFDRTEGGTRANLGVRYTFMATGGGSLSATAGQSFHLAGTNSYATGNIAELLATSPNLMPLNWYGSGLDTEQSDYVTSLYVDSGRGFRVGASARFDNADLTLNRADIGASGAAGPLTAAVNYAYLRTPRILTGLVPQSFKDLLEPERSEIQSGLNVRMTDQWRLFSSIRYDIRNAFTVSNTLGLGFDNDSFSASIAYSEDTDRAATKQNNGVRILTDRVVYFRFGLRTLGDGSVSNSLLR